MPRSALNWMLGNVAALGKHGRRPIRPIYQTGDAETGGSNDLLDTLIEVLSSGGLALLPAEGLYGLHVCHKPASDMPGAGRPVSSPLIKLRGVKGDSPGRPYIVLVGSRTEAAALTAEWPPTVTKLVSDAWPGPLTLVLPAAGDVAPELTRHGSIAIRCPGSLLLRTLADRLGGQLLSTSANRAGQPPPAKIQDVTLEIQEACDIIVDGGELPGTGSTLARVETDGALTILRPGLWKPSHR
ncbi:L-threonylcarbamoyladenylate synthase [Candidatus Eisenbacteria bacterium]|uniref:L-threonylcarbamoyladenylate synthase n=1 Tax=Eiseniibacteriota bacterium TaxID=2212470 RepID=A0ABV6YJ93_UNCEI